MHKCTFLSHTKFWYNVLTFESALSSIICVLDQPLQCTLQIQYQFFKVDFVFLIKIYTRWIYSYVLSKVSFVNKKYAICIKTIEIVIWLLVNLRFDKYQCWLYILKWYTQQILWWFLPKIITDAYFISHLRQMLLKLHNQNQRENSLIHYIVQKLIICAVTFEHANTPHATKEMLL